MKVMIRSRVAIRGWLKRLVAGGRFSDPWYIANIDVHHLPRIGEQFITPGDRAFAVTTIEWRYDLGEVHLFCIEYPRPDPVDPPLDEEWLSPQDDAELEVPDDRLA